MHSIFEILWRMSAEKQNFQYKGRKRELCSAGIMVAVTCTSWVKTKIAPQKALKHTIRPLTSKGADVFLWRRFLPILTAKKINDYQKTCPADVLFNTEEPSCILTATSNSKNVAKVPPQGDVRGFMILQKAKQGPYINTQVYQIRSKKYKLLMCMQYPRNE